MSTLRVFVCHWEPCRESTDIRTGHELSLAAPCVAQAAHPGHVSPYRALARHTLKSVFMLTIIPPSPFRSHCLSFVPLKRATFPPSFLHPIISSLLFFLNHSLPPSILRSFHWFHFLILFFPSVLLAPSLPPSTLPPIFLSLFPSIPLTLTLSTCIYSHCPLLLLSLPISRLSPLL